MKSKHILTYLLIGYTALLFAQNKTIQAEISWNGKMCNGGHGVCYISTSEKATANSTLYHNHENNELQLVIAIAQAKTTSQLLYKQLEKDFYLYTFTEDYRLPKSVLSALEIRDYSSIKQGDYLVKVEKDQIQMNVKLQ